MKSVSTLVAALLLTGEASAACVDDLRKLADTSFAYHEAVKVDGTEQRSTEGGLFDVYFDKSDEKITAEPVTEPNNQDSGGKVVAIRADTYGETFRAHDRISFLNTSDFVIRSIVERYEGMIVFPRGTKILKVVTTDYLYCANALQIPAEQQGGEKESEFRKGAEENRKLFFEAPELTAYIKRIKS